MVVVSLPTLDELREFVRKTLCEHDNLDLEDSPFFEGKITRHGQTVGLFFQVQGPRLLKVYALWADEENRILLYDALGNRFHEVRVRAKCPMWGKLRRRWPWFVPCFPVHFVPACLHNFGS